MEFVRKEKKKRARARRFPLAPKNGRLTKHQRKMLNFGGCCLLCGQEDLYLLSWSGLEGIRCRDCIGKVNYKDFE